MTGIVTVQVSITSAPTPSTLQRTGAIISQGSTTLTAGTYQSVTMQSDITPKLSAALAITSITWAGGVVTVTAAANLPAQFVDATSFPTTIAGCTPAGYNGQVIATMTSVDTFTYSLATNPGVATVEGTFTITDELSSQLATFFAQGSQVSVYVLELGAVTPNNAITALTAFITASAQFFYSYLVPRNWDTATGFPALLNSLTALTAKTYFFVTTTIATYTTYSTAAYKDVVALVEAPAIPPTEFSVAALFWRSLNYNPSSTNKVTPFAFGFVYDVTAYPIFQNSAILATLKAAYINVIGTAAEGGLTNTMVSWGTTADGRDFSYWYSVDWIQINLDLNISNAIINGSNNPVTPLYYNQDGINILQDVSVQTIQTAITDGMAIGTVARTQLSATDFTAAYDAGDFVGQDIVNAIPFITYLTANPNDYKIGAYNGLSAVYIPSRGFESIIFNIVVTDFVTA